MAGLSSPGIGSNLDVNGIVSKLMSTEQGPLVALSKKEASYQAQLSAFGSIKGALSSFQSSVASLTDAGVFKGVKATSSDSSVLTTSASSIAVAGTYSLLVSQLAQSQKLVAGGQTSSTASIGSGAATTLTFDFGTIAGNTFNTTTGKYGTTLTAATTSGSTTVTVPSTSNLAVGATISGAGIPAGATIASITDATNFVLSVPATATGAAVPLQAGATFTSNGNGTKTVTIDATNNSLQGIRDAINNAKIGVTATIINDGSGTPYRLALSSDNIGKTNSLKISASGDASVSALLAHDPAGTQNLSETASAQNAEFSVNGVAISKASNSVNDVIQGVTLNLLKTAATPINVSVARDATSIQNSVQNFVKTFNDLSKVLSSSSAYDPAKKQGAILIGDATVRMLQSQLRAVLNAPLSNNAGALNNLSQIGISFQKDGSLALDATKLNAAITNNATDVASLFATLGTTTDSLVNYNAATSATQSGNYAVNVSTLATQGKTTGNFNLNAGLTTIAAGTALNVNVNGTSATVALTAGTTYTATQLAAMIQSAINGTSAFSSAGITVAASIDGSGFLNITSNSYGSSSQVSMTDSAGTLLSTFMGTASNTTGADVAGTIGGLAATGAGQFLTASSGGATGLKLLVTGGATGARGTVNYSHGYAYNLNQLTTSLLATNGPLDGKTSGIAKSITEIGTQRDRVNQRLADIEARYRKQFTALDVMIGSMNQTSTYLTQQLANLPKPY